MFSFREFIKRGFLNAIGNLPDYQIILNAAGWYDKDVLLEADLAEIQSAIEARNAAQIPDAAPPQGTDADETPQGAETDETSQEADANETPQGAETDETPSGESASV